MSAVAAPAHDSPEQLPGHGPSDPASSIPSVAVGAALAVFATVTFLCAWLGDDAYITFRTIENFFGGYGLRWNVYERVQTFTHPLWLLLLLPLRFLSGELYFTTLAVSLALSWTAVGLLAFRLAATRASALLAVALLIVSRAFVDFSTSGLENPLSFLLLVLFFHTSFQTDTSPRGLFRLGLLASLGMLNRLDLALIFVPTLALHLWHARSLRALAACAAGSLPLAVWEVFSLVYYGFLFPNTAYAKLGTGLSTGALVAQAGNYFLWICTHDLATLMGIIGGLAVSVTITGPERSRALAAAAGAVLYVLYVIKIGGDFMAGRFLTAPLLVSAILVARNRAPLTVRQTLAGLAVILVFGFASPRPTLLAGGENADRLWEGFDGVINERLYFYSSTGLLYGLQHGGIYPEHHTIRFTRDLQKEGKRVLSTRMQIGVIGWYGGPDLRIVDPVALGDPLLARLPAAPGRWRIGHFRRNIPEGYLETIETGHNQIRDPSLAEYYDRLCLVTQGPIWSPDRWREIWRFHTGANQHLIDAYLAANPPTEEQPSSSGRATPSESAEPAEPHSSRPVQSSPKRSSRQWDEETL